MRSTSLILITVILGILVTDESTGQVAPPSGEKNQVHPAQDQILGTRAALGADARELVRLENGTEIREAPDWNAQVIAIVDIRVEVPVAEEQDNWLLVRYAGWKGWVHRTGEREAEAIVPFSTAPEPEVLARALAILGPTPGEMQTLGPFTLYTDVGEKRLLGFLEKVASSLPASYSRRYGLDPGTESLEAVVLFARDTDYREFVRTTTDEPGLPRGHATQGIAVLAVGDQSRQDVAAVLIHELTHLLNRRVFRDLELPWLDEGMSNDLAYCRIGRWSGAIEPATLGGRSVVIDRPVFLAGGQTRIDREVHLAGPIAALSLLHDREALLPLDQLLDLHPEEFRDPVELRARYDQSTFLIRFLLDPGDPDRAARFRAWLEALSIQEPDVELLDLPAQLGIDRDELTHEFESWLRSQQAR